MVVMRIVVLNQVPKFCLKFSTTQVLKIWVLVDMSLISNLPKVAQKVCI